VVLQQSVLLCLQEIQTFILLLAQLLTEQIPHNKYLVNFLLDLVVRVVVVELQQLVVTAEKGTEVLVVVVAVLAKHKTVEQVEQAETVIV
jgi:hypothetical protein